MRLGRQEKWVGFQFNHFYDASVRRKTRESQAGALELLSVCVVDFIAVAVPFLNDRFAVKRIGFRGFIKDAGVGAQAQGSADVGHAVLIRHQMDHGVGGIRIQFCAVGVGPAEDVAGEFHHGHLHAQAEAQEGDAVLTGVADGADFPFDSPVSEAARDQDAVCAAQKRGGIFVGHCLRIHPADVDDAAAGDAAVLQGLHDADVGVVKLDVFAHQSYGHLGDRMAQSVYHGFPSGKIWLWTGKSQAFAGGLGEPLPFHGKGRFVEVFHVQILEHMGGGNVAEEGDLVLQLLAERLLTAAYDDVRAQPQSLQFPDGGLGRLRLQLAGGLDVGNQGDMDQDGVFVSHIVLELADGLQKRLAFDIAHGAAHFDDGDAGLILCAAVETAFDLIGNMRDYLDRAAAVIPAPLPLQDGPVDFSGGDVGISGEGFVDEALVVPQIQIRLGSVVRHEDLSVLHRVHGARIDIDIGVKFLHGDPIAPGLQKAAQGGCGDSFSKAGDDPSGYKYIFYSHKFPSSFLR